MKWFSALFQGKTAIISAAIIALLVGSVVVSWRLSSKKPAPPEKASYHQTLRRGLFALSKIESGAVVMLGDSLTEGAPWDELMGCPRVVNRGINGDTTKAVLDRLGDTLKLRPRVIFLMIGANDVLRGTPTELIAKNLRSIFDLLDRSSTPYFVSYVLPVTAGYSEKSVKDGINALNIAIEGLVKGRLHAAALDLRPLVRDGENYLRDELSYDGIHLTPKGYEIWRDFLAPYVAQFCGPSHDGRTD